MTQSLIFNRYKFKTFCVFSILFGASLIISSTPAYSASDKDTWHNETELKLAEFCNGYKNEVVEISDYDEKDRVCSIELSGKNTTSEINEKIKQIAKDFNDSCNTNKSEYKNLGYTLAWSVTCEHITLSIEVDDEENITCSDNKYTFNSRTGECEKQDDLFDLDTPDEKQKDSKAEEDREDEGDTPDPGKTGETQNTNIEQLELDAQQIINAYNARKAYLEKQKKQSNK